MRVVVVIDETHFYHPGFLADLLRQTVDDVVGAVVVVEVPQKHNIESYLKRNWYRLRPGEMAGLFLRKQLSAVRDRLPRTSRGRFHSVRSVLRAFRVPFIEVRTSLNERKHVDWVAALQPDVLVSSNSLIFGKRLLGIPARACLNRHSALLPSYGGLWPVFQAFRSGEEEVGVSVHVMEAAIDRGPVLAQRIVPVEGAPSLSELYERCFAASAETVIEALDKVRRDDWTPICNGRESSYFSFPTAEHWQDFRRRGGRFV